jgi:hypothetical protein
VEGHFWPKEPHALRFRKGRTLILEERRRGGGRWLCDPWSPAQVLTLLTFSMWPRATVWLAWLACPLLTLQACLMRWRQTSLGLEKGARRGISKSPNSQGCGERGTLWTGSLDSVFLCQFTKTARWENAPWLRPLSAS